MNKLSDLELPNSVLLLLVLGNDSNLLHFANIISYILNFTRIIKLFIILVSVFSRDQLYMEKQHRVDSERKEMKISSKGTHELSTDRSSGQ